MTALKEPPMPKARADARPVLYHKQLGPVYSLADNGYRGRNLDLGRAREERLRRWLVEGYWPWVAGHGSKLDPAWLQSGNGSPVSGYDVRASKRHKGEHADGPGIAAEPETTPAFVVRTADVLTRLGHTGDLTARHLELLRARWWHGLPLRRRDHRARDQPERACAAQLQISDVEVERLWAEVVTRLYWALWSPDVE